MDFTLGRLLGYITVVLIVLASSRSLVKTLLKPILIRNKKNGKKSSLDLKILLLIERGHDWYGRLALLFALAHAANQFASFGLISLNGVALVLLLLLQAITGILQSKKVGNRKLWLTIHKWSPLLMFILIILHIINPFG
jgi:hypothetical protein